MRELVPDHVRQVRSTHGTAVARAEQEITERLQGEIRYWANGRHGNTTPERARQRIDVLEDRLARRRADLPRDARGVPRPPRILSHALVVPLTMVAPASRSALLPTPEAVAVV